jgi:hypothetical protein
LVLLPIPALAEGIGDACENKAGKKEEAVKSLSKVKKCLDPNATAMEKLHSCLKPCCAITFLASCYISEQDIPRQIKKGAAMCCSLLWHMLHWGMFSNRKKNLIFMKSQSQYDLDRFFISSDMYKKFFEYIKKLKMGENPVL